MKEKRKRKLVTRRGCLALMGMCGVISLCSLYYGRQDEERTTPDAQELAEATATWLAGTMAAMLVTNTPQPTETDVPTETVTVTPSATETAALIVTPAATTVEEASSQLADRLYLQGARVESVEITDGSAADGEIIVFVAYNVQARDSEAVESELYTFFDGIGLAIYELGLAIDSVIVVVGADDMALGVMSASAADVISFALGGMTPQEFGSRTDFTSLIPEQQQQQQPSRQQQQNGGQQQQNGGQQQQSAPGNCSTAVARGMSAEAAAAAGLDADGDGVACYGD